MILLSSVIVSYSTVFHPMHFFQLEDRVSDDGNWENAIKQLFTTDYNLIPCHFLVLY